MTDGNALSTTENVKFDYEAQKVDNSSMPAMPQATVHHMGNVLPM